MFFMKGFHRIMVAFHFAETFTQIFISMDFAIVYVFDRNLKFCLSSNIWNNFRKIVDGVSQHEKEKLE